MLEKYTSCMCDELRTKTENKIVLYQSVLKNIQLWEELNNFSELGVFDRDFVENELSIWLNYTTSDDMNTHIEDRLMRLPFEQAYCSKNPEFHTFSNETDSCASASLRNCPKTRGDILREVFNEDSFEWRYNPVLARDMSIQDKLRIIKRFEYMCYYVINTRDEILFDIQDILYN